MSLSRIEKRVFSLIVNNCPDKSIRILELSPGKGNLATALWEAGFKNIEAMDIYPENFANKDIKCHKGNLSERFPFDDESYDLVISVEGIEHLEDQYRFAAEINRVLKIDGSLALTTPNIGNFPSRVRFLFTSFYALCTRPSSEFVKNWVIEHIAPVTFYQLRHILHTNGIFIERITTDHIRRSGYIGILFWPVSYLATMIALKKEREPRQQSVNMEILRQIHTLPIYLGRTQIVYCRKKDTGYQK